MANDTPTSPDVHVLSGAYALDAVPPGEERDRFEQHLQTCEQCRVEVRSFRETAAVIGEAVATRPSVGLRARVLSQIAGTPQEPAEPAPAAPADAPPEEAAPAFTVIPGGSDGTAVPRPPRTNRVPTPRRAAAPQRTGWLVAAAVVLVAGLGLAATGVVQLQRAQQERVQAEQSLQATVAVLTDPGATRVVADAAGGGRATLVTAGSRAVVVAAGLPGLASSRTYQLWVLHAKAVTSAGLGPHGAAAGQSWTRLVGGLAAGDAVAISVEPAGGSTQPTTQPIAVLKV